MLIGGLQKLSLLDFPKKIAATLFTQGCYFRCHYCHNAELVLSKKFNRPILESEVLQFLNSRKGKLDGVVISGGEPTMQIDLPLFIKKVKDLGFLVKLDTSGIDPGKLSYLINSKLIDYVAMDFKAPWDKYPIVTCKNVDIDKLKQSTQIILNSSIAHEFRTTVVKGLHTFDDILEILKSINGADLYALQKFVPSSTLNPNFKRYTTLDESILLEIKKEAEKYVKECVIR